VLSNAEELVDAQGGSIEIGGLRVCWGIGVGAGKGKGPPGVDFRNEPFGEKAVRVGEGGGKGIGEGVGYA